MTQEVPSTEAVINIAIISQYKAQAAIDGSGFYNGQSLDKRLPRLLYIERKALQWAYNRNNADPTLYNTKKYVYSLCAPFSQEALTILNNQTAAKPVISGPASYSILVGQSATFTVSVVSFIPYTVQWYRNNLPIIGATSLSYTISNAQLTDSGSTFYAVATNTAGNSQSGTGVLTVTNQILGYYYYGIDYSAQLQANIDNVPYQGTFQIVNGAPLSVPFPSAAANTYLVIKYPSSQSIKTNYSNLPLNIGVIPSIAFDSIVTFNGFNYIFTRSGNPFGLNYINPVIFS